MAFGVCARRLAALCSFVASFPAPGIAQAHVTDIPRFSIGIAGGRHSGTLLWEVPAQTISAGIDPSTIKPGIDPVGKPYPTSDFDLRREIDIALTFTAHANVYLNQHIGFTGEFTYLGLSFNDKCTLAHDGGVAILREACANVGVKDLGVDQSGSTFLIQAGVVIRPFKPAMLQPYARGLVGFANTPRNSAAIQTTYTDPTDGPSNMVIYPDVNGKTIQPVGTVGAGIMTAPISGIQFLVEYRVSWLTQSVVTGATPLQNTAPPTASARRGFQSILFGIDIALKKEHGQRY